MLDDVYPVIFMDAIFFKVRQGGKVTKTKGAFPTDDALRKMLYLKTLDLKGAFRS